MLKERPARLLRVRFPPGSRIGPYEVLSTIGVGGMGAVFRARDTRLQREVAIKVVGEALSGKADILNRLEQDRLAGSLNHANIVAVYDVGVHEGFPYLVTELLQGETLRARLSRGPVPIAQSLGWAVEIAEALAAAHERGIVHHDLKPENVFITRLGHVKILDFGIARSSSPVRESHGLHDPTVRSDLSAATTGLALRTPGYMSPEHVRGERVDARSNVFSFGAILYEILTRERAFQAGSTLESGHAILHDDPADLPPSVPAGIANVAQRCLAKDPGQRFQMAHDVALALDALRVSSAANTAVSAAPAGGRRRRAIWKAALVAGVLSLPLAGFFAGRRYRSATPQPAIRQLTFRRGSVLSARFAADGRTVYFSAAWAGGPAQLYTMTVDSPVFRPLGFDGSKLLSVSPSGELALSLHPKSDGFARGSGTLARVAAMGGIPRELATQIEDADWAPDGDRMAVARFEGDRSRLEFPIGHVLFESSGWISSPRVSPSGDRVAFVDHPDLGDSKGHVLVIGPGSERQQWTGDFEGLGGLAWWPGGQELLVSASEATEPAGLWIARRAAPIRLLYRAPEHLALGDVSRDGRVLVIALNDFRQEVELVRSGEHVPKTIQSFDWAGVSAVSDDGSKVLTTEGVEGKDTILLRNVEQASPVKLGLGNSFDLSPDGRWALAARDQQSHKLWMLPTGAGEPRLLELPGVETVDSAAFFRDGKRIAVVGQSGALAPDRLYVYELEGARLRPISPPGIRRDLSVFVSLDQQWVAAAGVDDVISAYPTSAGEPLRIPEFSSPHQVAGWLADGSLLAFERFAIPSRVDRFDPRTRSLSTFTTLSPGDPTGVSGVRRVRVTPDGRTLVFQFIRSSSTLYLLGWREPPP